MSSPSFSPRPNPARETKRHSLWRISQIPNLLSLARIIGVLPLLGMMLILHYYPIVPLYWIVLLSTIFLSMSDLFDGYLARKFNWGSALGEWLDPVGDKMMMLLFLPLIAYGQIHWFPVAIIIARDILITALRTSTSVRVRFSGKLRTTMNMIVICLLVATMQVPGSSISWFYRPWLLPILNVASWGVLPVLSVWSLWDYYKASREKPPVS